MTQCCLNGPRTPAEHAGVPVTPEQIAAASLAAVAAGATELHLHPKAPDGADSMAAEYVDPVVSAVRAALPGIPIGVTTGAWTEPDADSRAAAVGEWTRLPDFASVNWHEPGAVAVAHALLDRGIGVEAGLFAGTEALIALEASGLAGRMHRLLVELVDVDPARAVGVAARELAAVAGLNRPVLLHGEGLVAWDVVRLARRWGIATRIGLEDTLVGPAGQQVDGNAELIAYAHD